MCTCAKLIALEITNIYENGDTEFHYDYCEDLKDGRGFTAGIAGFCTGTGDAWQVIQEYHKLTGGNDKFTSMDSVLAKYASDGSDSTAGLEDYLSTWEELGKSDTKFQHAQDTVRDDLYYNPAQAASNKLGLKLDISQGQIYDTGIEHGTGDDLDGMLALISATNKEFTSDAPGDSGSTLTINGHQVDEIVWLQKFIQVREADLKNPKEKENQGGNYWAQTTYRTKSYSYMIAQKEYMWTKSVTLLDNDGKPTTVSCSGGAVSSTRRKRGPDGRPIRVRRKRELVHSSKPPPNRRRRPVVAGKRNVEL
ncbi:glycosyl hydrolase family 46-domain-containing protein [Coemansia spiralis]|nr:glycosyl hydrolase family 46-domain-containing protein [Coemansia spiralis]